jgi:uncharacterized repeat protein (TIGR01451 family)
METALFIYADFPWDFITWNRIWCCFEVPEESVLRKLFVLFVLLIFIPSISSAETINGHKVEGWGGTSTYTLSWTNPSVTKEGYVIKVIDFNWKGDVVVSVTHDNETKNGVLSQAENSIFDFTKNTTYFQGVKIYPAKVSTFRPLPTNIGTYPCCPAAEIEVSIAEKITEKKPKLELTILSDWGGLAGYTYDFNINIKNTGDESFSEGNVTINLSGLEIADTRQIPDQSLTYNPSKDIIIRGWSTPLFANNSYDVNLSLKSPFPANRSSFTLKAVSYFKDSGGIVYPATVSETVSLKSTLGFKKLISAQTIFRQRTYDRSEIDTAYLPKFFGLQTVTVVNVIVENTQSYPLKSVVINDTVMNNFVLVNDSVSPVKNLKILENNTKLQWVFDLNETERKELRYEMIAQKTGTFTAPAATAQWVKWGKTNTQSSTTPSTTVHGVFIVVLKKTDKSSFRLNESLNISVTLENIGNYPAGINVTDILPENSTFISGTTTFSAYLMPKESASFEYEISSGYPAELEIPSPQVTFWKKDYEGSYGVVPAANVTVIDPFAVALSANTTNITQGPEVVPVPTETPIPKSLIDIIGEEAPWLEGAVPVVMLLIAIILMLMLHVINK